VQWVIDANLARNGGQDIHKLRGLNRRLRHQEKFVFNTIVLDLMDHEVKPDEELLKKLFAPRGHESDD